MKSSPSMAIVLPVGSLFLLMIALLAQWATLQRNLVLIDRVALLVDPTYAPVSESKTLFDPQVEKAVALTACHKDMNPHQCVRALMAEVDGGITRDELAFYLERMAFAPAAQVIVASYAGEVWYRTDFNDDAIMVWRNWLTPLHKIDKASRLYDAGRVDSALVLINTLDLETQIESGVRRGSLTRILIKVAQESARNRDYDTAEIYWRRAIIQYPERAGYHFNLAVALQNQNRFDEALTSLHETVHLQPSNVSYQLRLALALDSLGREEKAREVAMRVLFLEPNNQVAKNLLEPK